MKYCIDIYIRSKFGVKKYGNRLLYAYDLIIYSTRHFLPVGEILDHNFFSGLNIRFR